MLALSFSSSSSAMLAPILLVLLAVGLAAATTTTRDGDDDKYKLPEGLLIGAGGSALQTEGAYLTDGKAESQADYVFHTGKLAQIGFIKDLPDVAANTYERFREDVAKAKELKLQVFRLSFSWSRLLPTGNASRPNQKGVDFYHAYLDAIIDAGMKPLVTLYHFDHPQKLQADFMGWESEEMVDKFDEYAKFAFKTYGQKVKLWMTMNEPNFYCIYFHALFVMSGEYKQEDLDFLRCMRHFVLAHTKAYRTYKRLRLDGQVGLTVVFFHAKPLTTSSEDIYAADMFNDLHVGSVLNPIVFGDYPQAIKRALPGKLPEFTDEQKKDLANSADFLGINVYSGVVVSYTTHPDSNATSDPIFGPSLNGLLDFVKFESHMDMDFTKIDSEVIKRCVLWTWQRYGKPIIVAENGYGGSPSEGIHDPRRSAYHSAYLRSLVDTIKDYKVDVLAYSIWSLIDCYEWSAGFSRPFGLVHVDYEGKTLNRTLKDSSSFFQKLADTRTVPLVLPPPDSTPKPSSSSRAAFAPASLLAALLLPLAVR